MPSSRAPSGGCRFRHLRRNSVRVPTQQVSSYREASWRGGQRHPYVSFFHERLRCHTWNWTTKRFRSFRGRCHPQHLEPAIMMPLPRARYGHQRSVSGITCTEHPGPYLAVGSNETGDEHWGTQNVCATRKTEGRNSTRLRSLLWSNHLLPCTRTSEFNSRSVRTLWASARRNLNKQGRL